MPDTTIAGVQCPRSWGQCTLTACIYAVALIVAMAIASVWLLIGIGWAEYFGLVACGVYLVIYWLPRHTIREFSYVGDTFSCRTGEEIAFHEQVRDIVAIKRVYLPWRSYWFHFANGRWAVLDDRTSNAELLIRALYRDTDINCP
jgi:hypothetical protein